LTEGGYGIIWSGVEEEGKGWGSKEGGGKGWGSMKGEGKDGDLRRERMVDVRRE